jgi:hypothetical protein
VTISTTLPDSFFVETEIIERVADSRRRVVGMLDFSRSMTYSWLMRSAKIYP